MIPDRILWPCRSIIIRRIAVLLGVTADQIRAAAKALDLEPARVVLGRVER